MNILALDQSSKETGWSVWSIGNISSEGEFKTVGLISLNQSKVEVRLTQLRERVKKIIEDYNIKKVYLEDIQLQSNVANNVKTYKILSYVIGNLIELCNELGLSYELVPSNTWKSALGIKGSRRPEQKANAAKLVKDKFNITVTQDEADAVCIGMYAVGQK